MKSLEGKVAIVTGASRGLGRAIAIELGSMGAIVVGTATGERGLNDIEETFKKHGIQGKAYALNLSDFASIPLFYDAVKKEVGIPQLLINNAGLTRDNLFLRMKQEEWDAVIDTNLTGTFHLTRACIREMVRAQWGRIISLSSVVGSTGSAGQTNYAASKAALIGFSKSLALEICSRNITVNVVSPGFIESDMTNQLSEELKAKILQQIPMGRRGQAEDIAYAVGFLASPRASYITGQTLHVNGGMYFG